MLLTPPTSIHFQAQVGEGLGRGLGDVIHLHALRRYLQQRVSHPLHFSCFILIDFYVLFWRVVLFMRILKIIILKYYFE